VGDFAGKGSENERKEVGTASFFLFFSLSRLYLVLPLPARKAIDLSTRPRPGLRPRSTRCPAGLTRSCGASCAARDRAGSLGARESDEVSREGWPGLDSELASWREKSSHLQSPCGSREGRDHDHRRSGSSCEAARAAMAALSGGRGSTEGCRAPLRHPDDESTSVLESENARLHSSGIRAADLQGGGRRGGRGRDGVSNGRHPVTRLLEARGGRSW